MSIAWPDRRAEVVALVRQVASDSREWLLAVDRRVLVGAGIAITIALAALAWVLSTDQSRVLDAREVAAVRSWALSTQAPSVASAFNDATHDGKLTANEVRQLMEVAKAADPPPGLYQPVGF